MKLGKLKRWLLLLVVLCVVALMLCYNVVTSGFFIRRVVLPALAGPAGLDIAAESASVSPLRGRISAKGLVVGESGNPLAKVGGLEARFSPWSLLGGGVVVDKLVLDDVEVELRLPAAAESAPGAPVSDHPQVPSGTSPEIRLPQSWRLAGTRVNKLDVKVVKPGGPGIPDSTFRLRGINIELPLLAAGGDFRLRVAGAADAAGDGFANSLAEWRLELAGAIAADGAPRRLAAEFAASGLDSTIGGARLANGGSLELAAALVKIDEDFVLEEFSCRGGLGEGEADSTVRASGKISPSSGLLEVERFDLDIDGALAGLAARLAGMAPPLEFASLRVGGAGRHTLDGASEIAVSLAVAGVVPADSAAEATPMDIAVTLDAAANWAAASLDAKTLRVAASRSVDGVEILSLALVNPMSIAWADGGIGFPGQKPDGRLVADGFPLELVQGFLPSDSRFRMEGGRLFIDLELAAVSPRELEVKGTLGVDNLVFGFGDGVLPLPSVKVDLDIGLDSIEGLNAKVNSFNLAVADGDGGLLSLAADGACDLRALAGQANVGFSINASPVAAKLAGAFPSLPILATSFAACGPGVIVCDIADAKFDILGDTVAPRELSLEIRKDGGGSLRLSLSEPLPLDWSDEAARLFRAPLRTRISSLAMPLDTINHFLPEGLGDMFAAGSLDTSLAVELENHLATDIKLNGGLFLRGLAVNAGGREFRGADLRLGMDVGMRDYSQLRINTLDGQLSGDGRHVADLTLRGSLAVPFSQGAAKLDIASDTIDLPALTAWLADGEPEPPGGTQAPEGGGGDDERGERDDREPPANDLGGLVASGSLDLRKIIHSDKMLVAIKGDYQADNGAVEFNPLRVWLNGIPISGSAAIDMGHDDGYHYQLALEGRGVPVASLLAALGDKVSPDRVEGEVAEVSIAAKGKGFSLYNLRRHLDVVATSRISGFSMPVDAIDNPVVNLAMLPVRVLANIDKFAPGSLVSGAAIEAVKRISGDILDGGRGFSFSEGKIALKVSGTRIHVNQLEFVGERINRLASDGIIDIEPPYPISIRSQMEVGPVKFPLKIDGTLFSPRPDIKDFIHHLLRDNAANLLNPRRVIDVIDGAREEGGKLRGGIEDILRKLRPKE